MSVSGFLGEAGGSVMECQDLGSSFWLLYIQYLDNDLGLVGLENLRSRNEG